MKANTNTTHGTQTPSHHLASWACSLRFADLPSEVVDRTKSLFLDWLGSALAGRHHISVTSMVQLTRAQGPTNGKCEIVGYPELHTSPVFAALVNAASSHVVEQDDLHNSSMMHPVRGTDCVFSLQTTFFMHLQTYAHANKATVVFPAALAVAQGTDTSGKDFITACNVGYEFACRYGERLGKSHYKVSSRPSIFFRCDNHVLSPNPC